MAYHLYAAADCDGIGAYSDRTLLEMLQACTIARCMLYNVEYSECTVVSFLTGVKFSSFQGYSKVLKGVPHPILGASHLWYGMHIFRSLSLTRGHAGEEN